MQTTFQMHFLDNAILLKYDPEGPTDNKSSLVQVMAWCWTGDKQLHETLHMMIWFVTPQGHSELNSEADMKPSMTETHRSKKKWPECDHDWRMMCKQE